MKKIYLFIIFIYFVISYNIFAQIPYPCGLTPTMIRFDVPGRYLGYSDIEIRIFNQTLYFGNSELIKVKIIPVGAFFNRDSLYSPKAKTITSHNIAGKELQIPQQTNFDTESYISGNFDGSGGTSDYTEFSFGYGKYKFVFYRMSDSSGVLDWHYANYLYIDFRDKNIPIYTWPPNVNGSLIDMRIDYFSKDTITFQFDAHYDYNIDTLHYQKFWHINLVNKEIKVWDKYGTCIPIFTQRKGIMYPDITNISYLKWPINANQYNGNTGHINPGEIGMNLKLTDTVSTRDTLIDTITNITVTKDAALLIGSNMVFNMITPVSPAGGYNNLIIEDSATGLVLYANAKLNVYSPNWLTFKSNSYIRLVQYSEINIFPGATLCNEGATVIGLGRINFINGIHQLCSSVNDILLKDSAKIVLSDSAVLEIPDNTILHFTGFKSGLIMNPYSKLKFGVGCKIIFDSSASLIANGATFTSIDSTLKWDGIFLSNSDADTITNCTFSNAVTALTITNDANAAYKNRIITNNTFNIPSGGICKGIYGENNYKMLIKGNTFNMPVYFPSASPVPLIYVGVYLKNSSTIEAAGGDIEEDQSTNYSLNIIDNTFSNGCASLILANYTSNYLPYIISDNTFNNTASVNIIGMKISGTIRDNNFTSEDVPLGIHLINSSPNLFKNTINSRDVGLHLAGHCYPNLAPYVSGEDLVWTGGNNYITTSEIDNIQLSSPGFVNTDFGNNNFTIDNSSSYHIYGWLESTHNIYYARDNCWNGSNESRIYLKTYGSNDTVPEPVINTSNYDCSSEVSSTGWNVSYNGNGKYDSVKLTDNYTGEEHPEEDILYTQALSDYSNGLPVQAIIDFKYLIDNYPEFEKMSDILYEFYSCYQLLDTNEGENYREPLYQNIVDYLNEKILSREYENNAEFCDNAYDIILMAQCIIELNAAAGGYEFLAFNHPDPDIRLAASWNYAEIEELINSGNGGGVRDLEFGISDLEFDRLKELKELNKLNELISNDPLMSKMKRNFDKTSIERKKILDKQISRETKNGEVLNDKIKRSLQIDIQKEERAKRNVFELKNATKEEKEMRRMEDMALSTLDIRNEIKINSRQSVPVEYNIEQNYPNPFNPVTTIKYSIPKDGLVTLKIYDVLGKEVMTLVNETKETGIYEVEFNGGNLASGAYFYKIESGMFTNIKRMILIK